MASDPTSDHADDEWEWGGFAAQDTAAPQERDPTPEAPLEATYGSLPLLHSLRCWEQLPSPASWPLPQPLPTLALALDDLTKRAGQEEAPAWTRIATLAPLAFGSHAMAARQPAARLWHEQVPTRGSLGRTPSPRPLASQQQAEATVSYARYVRAPTRVDNCMIQLGLRLQHRLPLDAIQQALPLEFDLGATTDRLAGFEMSELRAWHASLAEQVDNLSRELVAVLSMRDRLQVEARARRDLAEHLLRHSIATRTAESRVRSDTATLAPAFLASSPSSPQAGTPTGTTHLIIPYRRGHTVRHLAAVETIAQLLKAWLEGEATRTAALHQQHLALLTETA